MHNLLEYSENYSMTSGRKKNVDNTLKIIVPLKYLINFRKFFDLPLINCEIELHLSWSKECKIFEISIVRGDNPVVAIQKTGATFYISSD